MGMLQGLRLRWAKARALSVLQTVYQLSIKEPLKGLDDADLRIVTRAAIGKGGNAFDAAAGFMIVRMKAALKAAIKLNEKEDSALANDLKTLVLGMTRTKARMKFPSVHDNGLREILDLRRQLSDKIR